MAQLTGFPGLGSLGLRFLLTPGDSKVYAMKNRNRQILSRREFAQRAALLSATASFVSAEAILPVSAVASQVQSAPKLSAEGQAEADSRYQQIVVLFGSRLDEKEKARIKTMCAELQPSLERVRNFPLGNGDAPALYLKPLVERPKKPHPAREPQSGTATKKP
jgi:hypothetical protein